MKRFAFYGRVSTEDQQDPRSSRNWQLARSRQVIEPGGEVVAEFFDIGQSRSLPWKRRPEAARLLETFKDQGRGFDAVVIGEPQRAFYGNQFGLTFPVFTHFGVELWVPEVGGAVDPGSEAHDLVMSLYGGMSKGERMRIKTRVRSAMASQAAIEGRFLGGRPPYGYQLVDAGPHPNPGKAATGQRLRKLSPDLTAAAVVLRIFEEYASGLGLKRIATGLNADGIPSPSAHDPERNRHRAHGHGKWSHSAIRSIIRNPRYTGYEIWNKQRKDEVLVDVDDVALGHVTKQRWNHADAWIRSAEPTHEPLISVELFDAAQAMIDTAKRAATRPAKPGRHYLLAGRMRCELCGRRMQSHWSHGRVYYRCKYPDDYPGGDLEHPKNVFVQESAIVPGLDAWIASLFDDDHIDQTCATLAGVSEPDPEILRREDEIRAAIIDCDRRLKNYRALLDADDAVSVAVEWISETQAERKHLERQLGQRVPGGELTAEEVKTLVAELRCIIDVLAGAEPADKADLYDKLGISLSYDPSGKVSASAHARGPQVGVGGALLPLSTPHLPERSFSGSRWTAYASRQDHERAAPHERPHRRHERRQPAPSLASTTGERPAVLRTRLPPRGR